MADSEEEEEGVAEVEEQDKFKNVYDTAVFENIKTENWGKINMKEAMFYTAMPSGAVKCNLCARNCIIQPGKRGYCGVRENRNGRLYSLVYGKVCAYAIDPIEKKPFYHFFPGTLSFSFSTVGCNFKCPWCQNWEISQPTQIFGEEFSPEDIVKMAKGTSGISYTYTEPTVFFEFARDCAILARKEGLYNTFVSNGYMTDESMKEAIKFLDAIRIDLKAFNPDTYKKYLAADIEVVKKNIKEFNKKIHTEVINLIIPEVNDNPDEIRALCEWLKEVDKTIPLHFTAYYPAHKFTKPPTPLETLIKARNIGLDVGIEYVYTGNIPGYEGENTYCPNCGTLLIERYGFMITKNILLRDGKFAKCPECGRKIKVVMKLDWMEKI